MARNIVIRAVAISMGNFLHNMVKSILGNFIVISIITPYFC
jgi:hypothetical protein